MDKEWTVRLMRDGGLVREVLVPWGGAIYVALRPYLEQAEETYRYVSMDADGVITAEYEGTRGYGMNEWHAADAIDADRLRYAMPEMVQRCESPPDEPRPMCPECGAVLVVSEWPFCPHGFGTFKVVANDIPGGLVVHNLGPEPVKVYSHSERRAIMRARGLVERVEHVDGDRHVGRMV